MSSVCILTFFASSNNNANAESYPSVYENNDNCAAACESSLSSIGKVHKIQHPHNDSSSSNNAYQMSSEMILASSPISNGTHSNNAQTKHLQEGKENNNINTIIECDYVIIGHGKAGQSAVRTIQKLEPTANVTIIDPNNNFVQNSDEHSKHGIAMNNKKRGGTFLKSKSSILGRVRHLSTRASYIDHSKKLIHTHPITTHSPSANSYKTVVHYRKSALIATGSRGAPPPESCIRQDARSRVLELRSTSLPTTISMQPDHQSAGQVSQAYSSSMTQHIPVLDPPTVRSLSILAASQSAIVAIMGSGIEALELAAYCARVSSSISSSSNQEKNSVQSNGERNSKKVFLLFGNSAPMSNQLPRYLSAAVSKRLRQNGIEVEERSMTRYISLANATDTSDVVDSDGGKNAALPKLEIYTVKSYDSLDSKQILADLLVYAPSVEGVNGTSVIPTISNNSTTNHLPWSSLISPPMLTSYLDDGRIATNNEFLAASSIYAAGSVAKYPNARGQAAVAGGRHVSAELVGEIAARNMVGGNANDAKDSSSALPCYVQESIPVWRSDVIPYLPTASTNNEGGQSSSTLALYSMGIHALCVGRCDSEVMATHGFWWTNSSSNSNNGESKNDDNGKRSNSSNSNPNAFMRRATKRSNSVSSNSTTRGRGSLPVYGSGVVFYLNRSGNIEGIMLFGLPFSTNPNDVQSQLNNDLVKRLKDMIRSNGGIAIQDHSEKILRNNSGLNIDVNLLSYLHLVEESKYLASMALSGSMSELHKSRRVSVLGKPLHRYTPIKPFELTNLGKITRRDEMGHTTDEDDMFYPSMTAATATTSSPQQVKESGRPPSLKRIYPMQQGGTSALVGTEEYELEREMERRQLQIERGRPPKEEPLWLRQVSSRNQSR